MQPQALSTVPSLPTEANGSRIGSQPRPQSRYTEGTLRKRYDRSGLESRCPSASSTEKACETEPTTRTCLQKDSPTRQEDMLPMSRGGRRRGQISERRQVLPQVRPRALHRLPQRPVSPFSPLRMHLLVRSLLLMLKHVDPRKTSIHMVILATSLDRNRHHTTDATSVLPSFRLARRMGRTVYAAPTRNATIANACYRRRSSPNRTQKY